MRLNGLCGIVLGTYSTIFLANVVIPPPGTSALRTAGDTYRLETQAKKEIVEIEKNPGLEDIDINIVFIERPPRGIHSDIKRNDVEAISLGNRKWIINMSKGYRNLGVLKHEMYHVYVYETKKFPFSENPTLKKLSFVVFYEQWRANQYALYGYR